MLYFLLFLNFHYSDKGNDIFSIALKWEKVYWNYCNNSLKQFFDKEHQTLLANPCKQCGVGILPNVYCRFDAVFNNIYNLSSFRYLWQISTQTPNGGEVTSATNYLQYWSLRLYLSCLIMWSSGFLHGNGDVKFAACLCFICWYLMFYQFVVKILIFITWGNIFVIRLSGLARNSQE